MTTTPSTPPSLRCSRAPDNVAPSSLRRLTVETVYPSARAASSSPNSVLAGPKSVVSEATTPTVRVRRVASARAEELRR